MDTPAFRPLDRLTFLTTVSLAWCAVGCAIVLFLTEEIENEVLALAAAGLGVSIIVSVLGSIVFFLMWMHRAASNLRALHPGAHFEFTPGWTVGWWFIPFASLFKPGKAMAEIARASHVAATVGAQPASAWIGREAPMVSMWWVLFVVMSIFSRVTWRIEDNMAVSVVDTALTIITAVAAILVVRGIATDQETAAARLERVRFADGIAHVVS